MRQMSRRRHKEPSVVSSKSEYRRFRATSGAVDVADDEGTDAVLKLPDADLSEAAGEVRIVRARILVSRGRESFVELNRSLRGERRYRLSETSTDSKKAKV